MAALSSITDNFTTGVFDAAKWSNSGDATKTGGRARIPNIAGSYKSLRSVNTTLRNGYALAELYPPTTGGAGSSALMGMSIALQVAGDGDGRELNVEINRETGLISFRNFVDWWEDGPTGSQITYNATNHRWVAISDGPAATYFGVSSPDTTKVYFFTSPTGEPGTWTEQRGGASRLTRPAWVTSTEDQQLWFTSYRATGTTEYVEVDNVNLPTTAAPAATGLTSSFQDDFSSGTLDKWPASFGATSVVSGKGQVSGATTAVQNWQGISTDLAVLPLTLDYLEAELYVQGGSGDKVVFGLFSGNDGESLVWRWEAGTWIPHVWNTSYADVVTAGTPVAMAANNSLRLAFAIGEAADRYIPASYTAGNLYMFTAPAGTTTWTLRFTVVAASVPSWVTAAGGVIYAELESTGIAATKITVEDVNLLTASVVPTVPSAPAATASRVSGSPTTLRIDWSAPTDTGNSAILDYEIKLNGGGAMTALSTSRTITVPDQSLGEHSFTVRARNGVGYSATTTASLAAYTAPTGLPLLGALTDDFNDSSLDSDWVPSTGVVQANGSVYFPAPSVNPATLYRRGSAVGQTMSFLLRPIGGTGVVTGMFLRQSSNRNNKIRIFVRDGVINGAYEQLGLADPSQSGRPYTPSTDMKVRIRHNSGTARIHLETSADGVTWNPLTRTDFAAPTWLADAEVGIEVFVTSGTTPTPVGVPTVPTSVVRGAPVLAADGTYSVNLTWQPPTSDGGSAITGYLVGRDGTDSSGASAWSQTLSPSARNQPFTLLSPGAAYNFSVRALNANGSGPAATGQVIMPSAPVVPPPSGATFTEDFTTLPNFTGSGTVWFPGYVYWGGYAGAIEPAGNSWNAVPSEIRNGLSVQPYSIIDDASANDGKALRITCRRATAAEKTAFGGKDWIGGSMESKAVYTYGYFEFRARFPVSGPGMFPALWLMAAENPDNTRLNDANYAAAEIDLLEIFGTASGSPWSAAAHLKPVPGSTQGVYTGNDDTKGWHVYGLEWTATKLRIWRDGVQVAARDDLAAWFAAANSGAGAKMRVRLNYTVATAGQPNWMPSTTAATPTLYMDVDYVRVYANRPTAQDAVPAAPAATSITNLQPTTLTINWEAPSNFPLVGVTHYTVSHSGWTSSPLPATDRAMDLTLFSPSTSYNISVFAHNAAGSSAAAVQAVTTPATPVTPTNPALQGVPAKVTGAYIPKWPNNSAAIDCMSYPASYNMLYMFAAERDDATPGRFFWNVATPTNIVAARARGTRIILSCGGATQHFTFTTSGQVTNFVNSVIAINTQWGGSAVAPRIDGVDLNLFEDTATMNVTLYTSIATQLRAYFGSNFIVTAPPAPWRGADMTACAALLTNGTYNFVSPQYYDGPGLSTVAMITAPANDPVYDGSVSDWVANVAGGDPSKIVVGFGVSTAPNYSSLATVQSAWTTLEARHPTLKGAFLWEGVLDKNNGFPYATTINPLVLS